MVFTRAMSRRTFFTRPTPSFWPVARWNRRLNCSLRNSSSKVASSSGVFARMSPILCNAALAISGVPDPGDEFGFDRQLGGTQSQRLLGEFGGNTVDLEHDPPRCDARHPEFRRALARTHAHFGRLGRHRHIRENPD